MSNYFFFMTFFLTRLDFLAFGPVAFLLTASPVLPDGLDATGLLTAI